MRVALAPAIAALLGLAVTAGAQAPARGSAKVNWTATVALRPDGTHVLGNPAARLRLDEFVSYTCTHCAAFQKSSEAPMRLGYVMPGKVSVRVVHVVRDPVDLSVALLTHCGGANGFFARHHAFLSAQDSWLARAGKATGAQRARWSAGGVASRMRAIASDLGFYAIMERRGLGRGAVDRCLADTALAAKLAAQRAEAESLGVRGTPGFAIGGSLLESVHDWASLRAALDARL